MSSEDKSNVDDLSSLRAEAYNLNHMGSQTVSKILKLYITNIEGRYTVLYHLKTY